MHSEILWLLVAGVVVVSLFHIFSDLSSDLGKIPGPLLAKFSDLWRVKQMHQDRYISMLRSLHKEHGLAVRIGPNIVSISDPRAVEPIYGLKGDFLKSDWVEPSKLYDHGVLVHDIFTTQDKSEHTKLKRPIANAYSMTTVKLGESYVDETIREWLRRLDEEYIRGQNARKPCPIDQWAQLFAFDVIARFTMGQPLGFLKQGGDIDGILKELEDIFAYRARAAQMPWLHWLFRTNAIVAFFSKPTNAFMLRARKILQARLQSSSATDIHQDFVQRCLEAQKHHPDIVNNTTMTRYVASNLLAGSDTSAVALRSILYYILKNPSVYAKVRQELDVNAPNLSWPISFDQSQNLLPYTNACIQEAFRVHWIGSHLLERVVPLQGFTLPDGRKLPPGTIVGMNGWTVHFDEATFGDDVEVYRPERWLCGPQESEDAFHDRLQGMKAADMTFSKGSRSCIGRNVAELELRKVVPTLFGLFDIELVRPEADWTYSQQFFSKQSDMDVRLSWRKGKTLRDMESLSSKE